MEEELELRVDQAYRPSYSWSTQVLMVIVSVCESLQIRHAAQASPEIDLVELSEYLE